MHSGELTAEDLGTREQSSVHARGRLRWGPQRDFVARARRRRDDRLDDQGSLQPGASVLVGAAHGVARDPHILTIEDPGLLPPAQELALIRKTVDVFQDLFGEKLRGWRTCFASHQTVDLLLEHFDFEWDGSIWNDDLPYLIEGHGRRILEIPFSSYADAALAVQMTPSGTPINHYCTWHTNTPSFIFNGLKASFDALYERGAEQAVLMPLALHDFVFGRPSRTKVLDDFIEYAKQFEGVVFTTHDEATQWWWKNYSEETFAT